MLKWWNDMFSDGPNGEPWHELYGSGDWMGLAFVILHALYFARIILRQLIL